MLPSQIICQNHYQLIQQLGENQSRQTWLASDLSQGNQVVVKLLAFSPQMEWEQLKLFEREAEVLQRLNHPQIPGYRDYFSLEKEEGDGLCWFGLVQDFIPGISLQQLITQGKKFTESQIKDIVTQLLEILVYLHELTPPIWHRDIKPSRGEWPFAPTFRRRQPNLFTRFWRGTKSSGRGRSHIYGGRNHRLCSFRTILGKNRSILRFICLGSDNYSPINRDFTRGFTPGKIAN